MAFSSHRAAALALLNDPEVQLSRKAGSFLGQCVTDPQPLSKKQHDWIATLLERAGHPSLSDGGDDD